MNSRLKRAVFFDRDGVLNRAIVKDGKPHPPANLDELTVLPGIPETLKALKAAGFLLIVVTNQPDVVRGTQQRAVVEAINAALVATLPLDQVYVCYHDDGDGCDCRKPKPGLLLQAAKEYEIDLTSSYMIGDRGKDILAGQCAGCKTILIKGDYDQGEANSQPDHRFNSIQEAGAWILDKALQRQRD